ncbi:UDP-glucose 4-epimerase [Caulobacter sp. Root655]|uniref:UDP-glucose 4-epimerase GalE n=1 Tax=Caulobacter sp. Root655 TaxID=1736578 RepID=UPI0006F39FC5|nr:UDP-glucose 4-epimerase GalE [Caulobacter sp. Root655]KRA65970.1 UDP-glucose 4-epimerase [Caulobacter sp. Root655]
MQTVLVAGGAGYVGSHTCLRLAQEGFLPVVFDDLSNGHREHVQWGPLEQGDIRDGARLDAVFAAHKPVAVLHFAASIEVGESTKNPGKFFDNNVGGAISLIEATRRAGVEALVFSSTCATFGDPIGLPMAEDHPQNPLNPYGRSKLMVEQALADYARYVGFRSVALRYFNAAGADPEGRIGEWHEPETHAIPLAIDVALGRREHFTIFGDDYDTRDGTAVRDYVHVLDLADAHVLALRHLLGGGEAAMFNLGTGHGTTVREMIAGVERVSGRSLPVVNAPRRLGDAPVLVGDNALARQRLGWAPTRDLDAILGSAWRWHSGRASQVATPAVARR